MGGGALVNLDDDDMMMRQWYNKGMLENEFEQNYRTQNMDRTEPELCQLQNRTSIDPTLCPTYFRTRYAIKVLIIVNWVSHNEGDYDCSFDNIGKFVKNRKLTELLSLKC